MPGLKSYLLYPLPAAQEEAIKTALGGPDSVRPITLSQLKELNPVSDGEMGTLMVGGVEPESRQDFADAIKRLRASDVHLRVLAVCESTASANQVELGDVFDDVVALDWASASRKILNFERQQSYARESRSFRSFLDTAVDGFWVWNLATNVVEWSHQTCEMTGYEPHEAPNDFTKFVSLIHPHDVDRLEQAIQNHFHLDSPYRDIEFRIRRKDGTYGEYVANGQAMRDEEGRPILMIGSLTDLTKIAAVQQQLEDTQKRFTVLFHRMNDAAVLADAETGIILEANEPAERLWGRSISELIGQHQTILHPPAISDEAKKAFEDHIEELKKNNRASIQVPILRKDGSLAPAEISSSLIEINGRMMILGVFRDITEREKMQQERREQDAQIQLASRLTSIGTLAAGVAHEINNPLTYVIGNLELLRDQLKNTEMASPDMSGALSAAITGGEYLREIVSDLKAISQVDSEEKQCNPADVVRIATRMAMSDLRHRAILDLKFNKVDDVPLSSSRLSQVVLNLLSNASRSFLNTSRSENTISVTINQDGANVGIEIKDNGRGIAPADLAEIFKPFFSRSARSGGTGLGLPIVRRIVEEAGGRLKIDSEVGVGTSARVYLPARPHVAKAVKIAPNGPQLFGKRAKLLIIDDDTLVSQIIFKAVQKNFDAKVSNDPIEALQLLQGEHDIDLVLCDLMMPEMNGRQLYEAALATNSAAPPFVFITGGGVTDDCIEFEQDMVRQGRLLYKPFKGTELRALITETLTTDTDFFEREGSSLQQTQIVSLELDQKIYDDLTDLLGSDLTAQQYKQMVGDLREAMPKFELLASQNDADGLCQLSHSLNGAAKLLGLDAIGSLMAEIDVAARSNDLDKVQELIGTLPSYDAALTTFVNDLVSQS